MSLAIKIKAIEDALIQLLTNASIAGVNGIVFNREVRNGTQQPPYLHVFMERSPIDQVTSFREEWLFVFTVMAVAASYTSDDADQARQIALEASTVVMDITNNRQWPGHVINSVKRIAWNADYTRELPTSKLFGSAMEMEAVFTSQEV